MKIGYLLPQVTGEGAEVVVQLLDRSPDVPAETIERILGRRTQPVLLGVATVTLELDDGKPGLPTGRALAIQLQSYVGLDAADLKSFPWRRVIASSVATYRARHLNTIKAWGAAGAARSMTDRATRPPGRPGRSAAEHQRTADRYRELVRQGEKAPTARIAAEESVSRSAAASCVSRARERGFLEPAIPGRAG